MSGFAFSAGGERFRFADLKDLLAKATPARSGDQLAGLAAHSELQRVAAQMALAELPLRHFLDEAVVPYESDEVTRLIVDQQVAPLQVVMSKAVIVHGAGVFGELAADRIDPPGVFEAHIVALGQHRQVLGPG